MSSEFWIQLSLLVVATGLMATADGFMVIASVRHDWIVHYESISTSGHGHSDGQVCAGRHAA